MSLVCVIAKAQMVSADEEGMCKITYQDDAGDKINISDDEDLAEAYEVARDYLNNQLKLVIESVSNPMSKSFIRLPKVPEKKEVKKQE